MVSSGVFNNGYFTLLSSCLSLHLFRKVFAGHITDYFEQRQETCH